MKYFIDQEFQEGFHKPIFGKRRHFIDLISIGIVAEDGRTYYAISNEFDIKGTWNDNWLRENVLKNLFTTDRFHHYTNIDSLGGLQNMIRAYGKSNKQIAQEIIEFVSFKSHPMFHGNENEYGYEERMHKLGPQYKPEFYGYYADYDWVLFCSLFGNMLDLPKGFPMYCRDLKQMLDDHVLKNVDHLNNIYKERIITFDDALKNTKGHPNYPTQLNEHNAIDDAKCNFQLYKFLTRTW